eukprot:TRINITY_DN6930_c0_g1_i2.p1 TRINITY_DN6930_c0_g1~~TRINITY_DN6930_c0_g1_i2.p1  ORF type:complete len:127 (+),score=21.17 TRINITY_DN6930_c0_g1_i2:45-425(+)
MWTPIGNPLRLTSPTPSTNTLSSVPLISPTTERKGQHSFFAVAAPPFFLTTAFLILVVGLSIDSWTEADGTKDGLDYHVHFGLATFTIEPPQADARTYEYTELINDCTFRYGTKSTITTTSMCDSK